MTGGVEKCGGDKTDMGKGGGLIMAGEAGNEAGCITGVGEYTGPDTGMEYIAGNPPDVGYIGMTAGLNGPLYAAGGAGATGMGYPPQCGWTMCAETARPAGCLAVGAAARTGVVAAKRTILSCTCRPASSGNPRPTHP
jgi:hypothetical protein